jgi:hypothetical protein
VRALLTTKNMTTTLAHRVKKFCSKKIKDNIGYPTKEYRTYRGDCAPYPLKEKCIGKSFEKKFSILWINHTINACMND